MKCPHKFIITTSDKPIEVECIKKVEHKGKCQGNLYSFNSNLTCSIKWKMRGRSDSVPK
jgi:hypothetical protein